MGKHLIVLGHGRDRKGNYDPGAKGNGTNEDKFLNREFLPHLEKYAPSNVDFYDDENMYANRDALNVKGYDSVTELHLDASNNGSGGHVIIYKDYSPDKVDKKIRDIVKDIVGVRSGDGFSKRSDLYNVRTFAKRNITYRLVELGFIDNKNDLKKIRDNIDEYARRLMEAITGKKIESKQVQEKGQLFRVQVGAFNSKQNAERLQKELKSKGYNAIIK